MPGRPSPMVTARSEWLDGAMSHASRSRYDSHRLSDVSPMNSLFVSRQGAHSIAKIPMTASAKSNSLMKILLFDGLGPGAMLS